ncbi:hypothetical protein F25303_14251 [Fusarium sp. NRRL 25303]|nr:hypothetical protein F25303_14251 [Fusarium sp. NRRL 25303]
MANPQLGHDQDNEEELECLCQTQSQRAQPLSRRYLWSETDKVEASDSRVATPVADSDNHRKIQHRPRKAYARDDMSICRLPEQAVNSKCDIPPRHCRARSPAPVPPSKCANDSPSMALKPLAKDTAQSDSLPSPPSGIESKMMQQPENRPVSQEQLVAEVKGIYAGLVMVETECIEVEKAASAISDFESPWWQSLFELEIIRYPELMDDFIDFLNAFSVETPQYYDLEALLSEVSLRSRSFCRLNSRLLPLLQARKGTPSSVRFVEFMT